MMVNHTIVEVSGGDIFILLLSGEININSLAETRRKIESLGIDQYKRIIIDLEKVTFFDSSGLGLLVTVIKQVKVSEGTVVICSPNNLVRRLLSTIRIDKYVKILDTQDQAVSLLKGSNEDSDGEDSSEESDSGS